MDPFHAFLERIKYTYSTLLWLISIVLITAAIVQKQTNATSEGALNPLLALFLFWFLIAWLGMMEGGQGALVGLQPIDKEAYKKSHPLTYQNTTLAHKGDNLERFIVGRQFLVVLVVFVINMLGGTIENVNILGGLPSIVTKIALDSGLALMMITISTGQLMSQTNSSDSMLDLINNRFMFYFVTNLSLLIEWSGLLHSVYAFAALFYKVTGTKPKESHEPPKTLTQQAFFVARTIFSCIVLGMAWTVTLTALFQGKTDIWDAFPSWASVVLFLLLMAVVGWLEGLQIALFAAINIPDEELKAQSPHAHQTCELVFEGQNLAAFLIGRQIFVTICMFVVARITSILLEDDDDNLLGVPDGVQDFVNTGLLGALLTAIHASLIWRVLASAAPFAFLSNPLTTFLIRLCLAVEQSGLCSVAWILARFQKRIFNFQPDHEHLDIGDKDDPPTAPSSPTESEGVDRRELFQHRESARLLLSSSRNSVSRRDSLLSSSMRISVASETADGRSSRRLMSASLHGSRHRAITSFSMHGSTPRRGITSSSMHGSSSGRGMMSSSTHGSRRMSRRDLIHSARAFSTTNIDFENVPNDDLAADEDVVEMTPAATASPRRNKLLAVDGLKALPDDEV